MKRTLSALLAGFAVAALFTGFSAPADAQVVIVRPAAPIIVAPRVYYWQRVLPGQVLPLNCGLPQIFSVDPNNGARLMANVGGVLVPTTARFSRCWR